MKIAIDLDKTIFNCKSYLYDMANKFFARAASRKAKGFVVLDRDKKEKPSCMARLVKFFKYQNFYEIENCVEIINSWYRSGIQIVLLSARPNIKAVRNLTRDWLDEHGVLCDDIVIACHNKPEFCKTEHVDILIENNLDICSLAAKYGLKSIYFDHQIAKNQAKKAYSWREIDQIVQNDAICGPKPAENLEILLEKQ